MRNYIKLSLSIVCGLFAGLLGITASAAPAPAPTQPVSHLLEPIQIPQSIFESEPPGGKDPFFPNSTRGPKILKADPVVVRIPEISLKGITGTVAKRLCILNNRTFEVGEESELKAGGQTVKVKCVEIKTKSVVVTINGLEKELNLGPL
ncbi:MAG TPA: hypothetical protein VMZ27_15590 [Candidatus Saccharimonadales bacterium]|nr:hypothetical protein [Candidatus Saccharimonadales bacterium]